MPKPKTSSKPKSKLKQVKSPRKIAAARKVSRPKYKSFRMQKRIKHPSGSLPGSFRLLWRSLLVLKKNWKLFGGIGLIYIVLIIILANGLIARIDVKESRDVLSDIFGGRTAQLSTGLTLFSIMISSSASPGEASTAYRSIATVLLSLVMIWSLRQVMAGKQATLRDAFYKSMYPLVPFLLVLIVVGIEFLPLALGASLYSVAMSAGLAATTVEQFVWIVFIFLLGLLALYLITASLMALYIVTLPDMTPMSALRSARELVHFRRWTVLRKLIILPILLLFLGALVMLPFLLFVTSLAQFVFLLVLGVMLLVSHAYIYSLYRELL